MPPLEVASWLRRLSGRLLSSINILDIPLSLRAAGSASREGAVFCRILNPELVSRAGEASILETLAFILQHEDQLDGLQKCWLLNCIPDQVLRQDLIDLLEKYGQCWSEIPFDPQGYLSCWTDLGALPQDHHPWSSSFERLGADAQSQVLEYVSRAKSLCLYSVNAASNHALSLSWAKAPWAFIADGNCFLTPEAWQVIRPLLAMDELTYLVVPTAPLADRQQLFDDLDQPPVAGATLPLIGFRRSAHAPFNATLRNGAGAETDILLRLGLRGWWLDAARQFSSWEVHETVSLPNRGRLVQAGWAYRLPPHQPETPRVQRDSIRQLARRTDMRLIGDALQRHPLRCWIGFDTTAGSISDVAVIAANARALTPIIRGHKLDALSLPAGESVISPVSQLMRVSGSDNTLMRTGARGSVGPICSGLPVHPDRVQLQQMIDSVCALVLDGHLNGSQVSLEHASQLLRALFLDGPTGILPNSAYISAEHPGLTVIDAVIYYRDFYPLLDAITLLKQHGFLSSIEIEQVDEWFNAFLVWLAEDSSSFLRQYSPNPVGTWYHLLILSVAAFLGRKNVAAQVFDNLPGLLVAQYRPDGSPTACSVGTPLRYEQLFNLQAWTSLAVLSSALGRDLFDFVDSNGIGLNPVFAYAADHLSSDSIGDGLSPAIWFSAMKLMCGQEQVSSCIGLIEIPPLADVNTGLPPFWRFCRLP